MKEETLNLKRKQIKEISKELKSLRKKMEGLCKQQRKLLEEVAEHNFQKALKNGELTIEGIMSLAWPEVTGDNHTKVVNFIASFCGVKQCGYNPNTYQVAIEIVLDQNKPLEDQMGILEFVPFIKPDENGIKSISIFECSLSEYGCYSLNIDENDAVKLVMTRYYRPEVLKKFPNIEKALEYVYEHHPYKNKGSEE